MRGVKSSEKRLLEPEVQAESDCRLRREAVVMTDRFFPIGDDWSDEDAGSGSGNPYPGEPTGIGFMVDGDLMGGETNACATFANPRLGNRSDQNNEFLVRALEVWTVTPCITIDEAEKLEMHRFFVDEQQLQSH